MSDILRHAGFRAREGAAVKKSIMRVQPYKRNAKSVGDVPGELTMLLRSFYQPFNEKLYEAISKYSLKVSPCDSPSRFLDVAVSSLPVAQVTSLVCKYT